LPRAFTFAQSLKTSRRREGNRWRTDFSVSGLEQRLSEMTDARYSDVTSYREMGQGYHREIIRAPFQLSSGLGPRLDFGCGHRELDRLVPRDEIIGSGRRTEPSGCVNWAAHDDGCLVANHVFYALERTDHLLVRDVFYQNVAWILFSDSKAGPLNRLLALLSGSPGALSSRVRSVEESLSLLLAKYRLAVSASVWGLSVLFLLDPKRRT